MLCNLFIRLHVSDAQVFSGARRRGTGRTVQRHFFLGDGGNVGEAFFDHTGRINVMLNFDWHRCEHLPESDGVLDALYEAVCTQDFLCQEPAVLELRECAIEVRQLGAESGTHGGQLAEVRPSSEASRDLTQNLTSTFADIWRRSSKPVGAVIKECRDVEKVEAEFIKERIRNKVSALITQYHDKLLRTGFVATNNKDLLYEREQFVVAGLCYMYDQLFDVMACLFPSGPADETLRQFLDAVGGRRFQTIPELVCFVQWGQWSAAVDDRPSFQS